MADQHDRAARAAAEPFDERLLNHWNDWADLPVRFWRPVLLWRRIRRRFGRPRRV